MAEVYLVQLVGVILVIGGAIALTASAHIFGARLTPAEKRRASDEWNRRADAYGLPINLDTITSALFLLGGIAILIWSKFSPCAFLAYWFPPLPQAVNLFLSCQ